MSIVVAEKWEAQSCQQNVDAVRGSVLPWGGDLWGWRVRGRRHRNTSGQVDNCRGQAGSQGVFEAAALLVETEATACNGQAAAEAKRAEGRVPMVKKVWIFGVWNCVNFHIESESVRAEICMVSVLGTGELRNCNDSLIEDKIAIIDCFGMSCDSERRESGKPSRESHQTWKGERPIPLCPRPESENACKCGCMLDGCQDWMLEGRTHQDLELVVCLSAAVAICRDVEKMHVCAGARATIFVRNSSMSFVNINAKKLCVLKTRMNCLVMSGSNTI